MSFRKFTLLACLSAGIALALPSAAFAHDGDTGAMTERSSHESQWSGHFGAFTFPQVFVGDLPRVPHNPTADGGSDAHARSLIVRIRDRVIVVVHVRGAAPGLPHAQHIHGPGLNRCPAASADADGNGLISTSEGAPDYGPIVVSLTTSGDTTPASGLAVDRFPVANQNGSYTYVRVFTVGVDFPADIAANLGATHIVTHGIDTNHNAAYDFSAGVSDLDPALPQEATVPAACGVHMQLH